jgi:hypothetical protein
MPTPEYGTVNATSHCRTMYLRAEGLASLSAEQEEPLIWQWAPCSGRRGKNDRGFASGVRSDGDEYEDTRRNGGVVMKSL